MTSTVGRSRTTGRIGDGQGPIRVLVVDDSAVIRGVLTRMFADEPDIEVVGTANDGVMALERMEQLQPDLVTLDVEMPVMDGLATLAEIRRRDARLPVIMFSTLTSRGALTTLDALVLGASDYVAKPSSVGDLRMAIDRLSDELLPKIRALTGRPDPSVGPAPGVTVVSTHANALPMAGAVLRRVGSATPAAFPPSGIRRVELICVAVSTGGPNALDVVIPQLPAGFRVPVVVVQHMPPKFTALLAGRLDARSAVSVVEGTDGMALHAGQVVIAPGGRHMVVHRDGGRAWISLNDEELVNSCRPSADVLFQTVAEEFGGSALGLVLTGMGRDGCDGARMLRETGAEVVAQDEESSVVWGMPGAVVEAGLANEVVSISDVARVLARRVIGR